MYEIVLVYHLHSLWEWWTWVRTRTWGLGWNVARRRFRDTKKWARTASTIGSSMPSPNSKKHEKFIHCGIKPLSSLSLEIDLWMGRVKSLLGLEWRQDRESSSHEQFIIHKSFCEERRKRKPDRQKAKRRNLFPSNGNITRRKEQGHRKELRGKGQIYRHLMVSPPLVPPHFKTLINCSLLTNPIKQ